jgi:hypothetical protein
MVMKFFYIGLLTSVASLFSFSSALAQAPQNDDICSAIALPLSADQNCSSALRGTTINATTTTGYGYTNPVECGTNIQPKDVWYKVTTTASGAGSTILHFKLSAAGSTPMVSGNMTLFRAANGSCPSMTMGLVSGVCINSGAAGFTTITMTAHFLTPNTTYYLRVNTVRDTDTDGTFDVCAYLPINTPPCTQYISPLSNATNVPVNEYVVFEWAPSPGATLYNFYLGTTNPLPIGGTSGTKTKDSTKLLMYNKKYYWSVAPRNSSGAATGCPVDSFTTAPAPANCVPLTTSNCRVNDTLKLVKLTGENGTSINNPSSCSPNGYADYTATTTVQLARGKAYAGLLQASFVHDYFTVWIDFNNDGHYTDNERLLNNLKQQWSKEPTPYTINIPASAATGTHKMRVRNVYYAVNPAVVSGTTDPCNNYTYSETEDYSVTIIPAASAPAPIVAAGTNNSCLQAGVTTIDNPTNNNTELVQVVDPGNAVIAAIDANGNDLGEVQVNVYKNAGAIRTLSNGTKVLDRNISVEPRFQPTSPVQLRLYITSQELAALQAADPTITGIGSLSITKFNEACATGSSGAGTQVVQTGHGTIGSDYYIDVTVSGFSNFYIHRSNAPLPVNILSFKGERLKNKIKLDWSTATETNNKGFELQRSADGRNFSSITFISSKAAQGNSNTQLQYNYTDERPMNGGNYYRLKQTDKDGNISYSNIVLIKNSAASGITIDVYPNPVKDRVKIKMFSTTINKVNIIITDLAGRVVKQQPAQLIAGDNFIEVQTTRMQAGQYLVKVICSNGCEGTVGKLVKE